MCDAWMPAIELALTWEQFHRLPRNAAYKYEYANNTAYLTPRAKHYHALLNLQPVAGAALRNGADRLRIRRMREEDVAGLGPVFAAAFHRTQPFGSLDDATRAEAARQCLERTRTGGDGPWVREASFVAVTGEDRLPIGAIFITLLPEGDPCAWDSYYWAEPPPPDCIQRRLGVPHLTWVFVTPLHAGRGAGTALLAAAVRRLLRLGYRRLLSTFLYGNESSMLWHWRNGFRLLAHPGSFRRIQEEWRKRAKAARRKKPPLDGGEKG
jgi:GNAT superfamily N-acetyltransferase